MKLIKNLCYLVASPVNAQFIHSTTVAFKENLTLRSIRYESLEELKEEKKRKKLNWNRILELENNHKREEKDNRKRLNRFEGRVVRYDHVIQLFHLYSGKILTASPNNTSHTEPRNFACYLDSDPSKHSRFKVIPAVDGYDPGDPVNHSDFINLYSDPDGFVGTSLQSLDPVTTLYPPLVQNRVNVSFLGRLFGGFLYRLVGKHSRFECCGSYLVIDMSRN